MALNPRMVNTDIDVNWGGAVKHAPAGTIVDIPPGSALEAAYGGVANLTDLTANGGAFAASIANGAAPDGVGSGV